MKWQLLLLFTCISLPFMAEATKKTDLKTPYEKGNGNQTATYAECIDYYKKLDKEFSEIKLREYGKTDVGKPLHLVILSPEKVFEPEKIRKQNKRILFIQNGIHPGEPEGIDASMMLVRDLLQKPEWKQHLQNLVIIVTPVYNIDGMLNRNSGTRANQLGPESYGFRGNARNLDLNRDYIKTESGNAKAFQEIFQEWQPDIFVETHTSNGADYQYVMTLIATQKDKLQPVLGNYMHTEMLPELYAEMQKSGFPMIPYVNSKDETPESGIVDFLESPRYSTGYAALFNTIGFMPETHMLKPFKQRLESTYKLLEIYIKMVNRDAEKIGKLRAQAWAETLKQKQFPLTWKLNEQKSEQIPFLGFKAGHKKSEVSGSDRLYYDRNQPFEHKIQYFNTYEPNVTVSKPEAYIIPQAWPEVIDRLKRNGIQIQQLKNDRVLAVKTYYITGYENLKRPFEGHYLNYNVQVRTADQNWPFYEGDYVVFTDQQNIRYILETLEPQASDSFFAWNFFDSILGRKEYFSPYIFEDTAAELLQRDPQLKAELEKAIAEKPELKNDAYAQLDFIYQRSEHYENTHNRYPVVRVENAVELRQLLGGKR
ncbi:M14 family metallopeptidase [Adhaeribacter sp. BT258]|uniref:M14 family metallopeptidase n=1 Tax=Adhaeribacter terrigena TaxID=2793070 RepID=A0ABS1C163_9BACT|nr:M14 family metallopeptidase [Adhaeribacter terrigena]MBK0402275.1 M14 family metallopeptidase [Adhaeribacter terrigena]